MTAMHSSFLLTAIWCFVALMPSVNAQGLQFVGDSRIIADLAVWFITDIANYIIMMLCLVPLHRKEHMATYAALMVSASFTVIQATVNIGYIFAIHNAASAPSLQEQVSLLDTSTFFGYWSSPFLFLAIVFLIYERTKLFARGTLPRQVSVMFISAFAYFGVLLLIATVAFGLYARATALEKHYIELARRATLADFVATLKAGQRATNANFTFDGFWFFSTIIITALAISTFVRMKRVGAIDKATRLVLLLIIPLYYAAMIVGIVFAIFASPSISIRSRTEVENINLANDLLSQFLYTTVMGIIIAMAFRRSLWASAEPAVALSTLGVVSSGRYVELEDPLK